MVGSMDHLKLADGDTIVIIGGGPAGSFFAMHVIGFARKSGINLSVIILERRYFSNYGPGGCNMCAGVLGGNFVNIISELDLIFDKSVIRKNVQGFKLNINDKDALIIRQASRVYTIFRGMGPQKNDSDGFVSFDGFLLKKAREYGATVLYGNVKDILIPKNPYKDKCIVKYITEKNEIQEFNASLVVGAFGVNSELGKNLSFGYEEPKYWHTCQTELLSLYENDITNYINIFSRKHSKFLFTATIPKERYVTVTGIGRHVRFSELIRELKELHIDSKYGLRLSPVCHCHPRLPVTQAKNPFHTRVVMIGDACVSRYLKNGIESAFFTAKWAADTAISKGIDENAFKEHYYPRYNSNLIRDNRFGKVMFFVHNTIASNYHLSLAAISLIREESPLPIKKQWLSNIVWHMFVGDKPYKHIFLKSFKIIGIFKLWVKGILQRKVNYER